MAQILCSACGTPVSEGREESGNWAVGLFGFVGGGFLGFLGGYLFALVFGLFSMCGAGSGSAPLNLNYVPMVTGGVTAIVAGAVTAWRLVVRARRLTRMEMPLSLCLACLTAAVRKKRGGGSKPG